MPSSDASREGDNQAGVVYFTSQQEIKTLTTYTRQMFIPRGATAAIWDMNNVACTLLEMCSKCMWVDTQAAWEISLRAKGMLKSQTDAQV